MMGRDVSPPPLKRVRVEKPARPAIDSCQEDATLTLYSWNINGISPFIQRSITSFFKLDVTGADRTEQPHASLRDFLSCHDFPTLLFLQEVKINPDDRSTQRAVEQAVRRQSNEPPQDPDYVVHFSLPTDRFNATGFGRKVYGVCSVVRTDFARKLVKRMREVEWDSEGRFSVIETRASDHIPKLAIFNVYLVNGTDNAYKDSCTGEVIGTRHDRKLQVHTHLQAECQAMAAEGFEIVIAGDCNIARSYQDGHPNLRTFPHQHVLNRQDFARRFFDRGDMPTASDHKVGTKDSKPGGLGMVDVYRTLHPDERGYSHYPRGRPFGSSCDRVDMILCSKFAAEKCVEARILATPGDRGPSDHVPIYAAFDFSHSQLQLEPASGPSSGPQQSPAT